MRIWEILFGTASIIFVLRLYHRVSLIALIQQCQNISDVPVIPNLFAKQSKFTLLLAFSFSVPCSSHFFFLNKPCVFDVFDRFPVTQFLK